MPSSPYPRRATTTGYYVAPHLAPHRVKIKVGRGAEVLKLGQVLTFGRELRERMLPVGLVTG